MSSDSNILVRGRKRQRVPNWQYEEGHPIWRCPSNKRHGIWPTSVMLKIGATPMSYEQAESQAMIFNAAVKANTPLPPLPAQPGTMPLVVIQKVPVPVRVERPIIRRVDDVRPGEQLTIDQAIDIFVHSLATTKNGGAHQKARGYYLDCTSALWGKRYFTAVTTEDVHQEYLKQRPGREAAADQWLSHTRALFLFARDHLFQSLRASFPAVVQAIEQLRQREKKARVAEFGDDGSIEDDLHSAAEISTSIAIANATGLYSCADAIMLHTYTGLLGSQLIRLKASRFTRPGPDGRFRFKRDKTDVTQIVEPHPTFLHYVDQMVARNARDFPRCDYLLINSRTGERFSEVARMGDQFRLVRSLVAYGPNQKLWSGARLRRPMPDPWPFMILPSIADKDLRGLRKNYCSEIVPRFTLIEAAKRTGHTFESAARMFEDHYVSRGTTLSDITEPPFAWIDREWLVANPRSRGHRELAQPSAPKLIEHRARETEPA